MNWTGGRLHRSSYKMKSSAKHIGKQRVAQAKTQVLDRYGDAVSPKVAAVVIGREKSCDDGPPSTIGVLCASTHKGKRSTSPYIEGLRRKRCRHYQILDSPSVGVDEMRKKLLDKKDWACLSPSRPYRLPIGRDHDAGQVEKRQSLLHMSSPSRCVPQQDLPSLPTKGQKTKTVYPYPTQLRSDDIEVWIEQKKGVTQPETPYTRKHTVTQEFMEPMLSGSNPSGDSANPIHQSDANISQYTSYGIHEQYELGKRAENSPSPDLSGLPILDRRGSFAIVDGQTRYVPPSPCKPPSSGFPGDNGGMGLSRDVIEPYNWRRTGPYHYQRNEAQDVRPKSLEWSEVAGNVTEHSSKYSRGDNSAVVQQREAIHSMEQPRIGCWETPSSDQDPFWPNIIPSPLSSRPRYRYDSIVSPQLNRQYRCVNRNKNQKYSRLTSPKSGSILYRSPQPRACFSGSFSKPRSYHSNYSSISAPVIGNHKVLVYGQAIDTSKERYL